jgi:hypothetical protein
MKVDLIDRTEYRKDLLSAYDDVSMEFDVLDRQQAVKAIPLDLIKESREEIENEVKFWSEPPKAKLLPSVKAVRAGKVNSYKHCLEILDKLLESEVLE